MSKTYAAPQAFSEEEYEPIPMVAVQSSQVAQVGYDPVRKRLSVVFVHGSKHVYQYPDVEPELHAAFVSAESIGSFFGKHIKPLPFEKFPAPVAA